MAWSTPRTWTTGEFPTAAMFNTQRDQLIDLDRRTSPVHDYKSQVETTTSTAYTNLATVGPAVSAIIGSTGMALISIYAALNNSASGVTYMSFDVSGASTAAANDTTSLAFLGYGAVGATFLYGGLTPGTTTFTAKYKVSAGTGTYADRRIILTPLGS